MASPAQLPSWFDLDGDGDEDLSDEQIQQLLEEAEARLRAKQTSSTSVPVQQSRLPKLNSGISVELYLRTDGSVTRVNPSKMVQEKDRALAGGIRKLEDPIALKKRKAEEKKATAGKDWYNLPKTEISTELRRDLQLLKMRNVVDPKRHYKKDNSRPAVPEFSAIGTIIEGPTEFYNARVQNKDRKKTFVDEVLAQEAETGRFKRKYNDIQKAKTSGKKAFYQALKAKRKGRVGKR